MAKESKLVLPQPVPVQQYREPQANIPKTKAEREKVLQSVREYCGEAGLVPPIPMAELRGITKSFVEDWGIDPDWIDYTAVLINNERWREPLANRSVWKWRRTRTDGCQPCQTGTTIPPQTADSQENLRQRRATAVVGDPWVAEHRRPVDR